MPLFRPVHLPSPLRTVIIFLVLAQLGLGFLMSRGAMPWILSDGAVTIPSAPGIELAWLDNAGTGERLDLQEVVARDQAGDFKTVVDPLALPVLNQIAKEERWFRLKVSNLSAESMNAVLDLQWRIYDFAELYYRKPSGEWYVVFSGQAITMGKGRASERWMAFDIHLGPGQSGTYYLRVQDYFRLPTQFLWWPESGKFSQGERFLTAKSFGFFCLWVGMVSFSAFSYALLRERDQLHYVLFVAMIGIFFQVGDQLYHRYMPKAPTAGLFEYPFLEMMIAVIAAGGMINFCLYGKYFLGLSAVSVALDRSLSWIRRLWWLGGCLCPLLIFPEVVFYYLVAMISLAIATFVFLMIASIRCWRAGRAQALFFLFGFFPMLISISIYAANVQDTVTRDDSQRMAFTIGTSLSMIFFSYATAFKHRLVLKEKIDLQNRYTDNLENRVEERTRELRTLNQSLATAVAERDRILGVIGHDLRAPTSSLYFFTRLLANEDIPLSRQELTDMAVKIGNACNMQLELLNNLLMWGTSRSWQSKLKPVAVPLKKSVDTVARLLSSGVRSKDLSLIDRTPVGLQVWADESSLQTVLRNLIGNSIKFTHTGGKIEVSAAVLSSDQIEIRVTDNGVGISPVRLGRLFIDVGAPGKGTGSERGAGIGLSLCRDLAISMGGALRVESEVGKGTAVILTLPTA